MVYTEDLIEIGKRLNKSKESYDAAMNKLTSGRGNLISSTERIRELGAKSKKKQDQKLIDRSENTQIDE